MSNGGDFGSESVPDTALFVAADEGVLLYPSVEAAERDLDASDVAEGVYPAAYGPNGECYRLSCAGNRVVIDRTGEPDRPEALKQLLLRFFECCEDPADATEALDVLVSRAWSLERNFRLRCPDAAGRRSRIPVWGCLVLVLAAGAILYLILRWSGLWPFR